MSSLLDFSLPEAVRRLRAGETTARDLAEAAIDAYERNGEALGAYKTWRPELFRQMADTADGALANGPALGPLHGIPVSVKDIYGVAGYPTFAGTPVELPDEWQREGPVVTALRRQLGAITGKTHTVEFAFGGIGANPHWATPRNPWDAADHRVPGGSSSGAGVSLATGTALAALGTDTAGSVRIPASVTGNAGLKTTVGRWSIEGIVPLSPSLDTPGVLARTVEDAAYAFLALDPASEDPARALSRLADRDVAGLRIGIPDGLMWEDCSPGVTEAVKDALDALAAKGARLVPMSLSEAEAVMPIFGKGGLAAVELYSFLESELPDWLDRVDPIVQQRMAEAATLPAREYLNRRRVLAQLSAAVLERFDGIDVIASPTVAVTPPRLADISEIEAYRQTNLAMLRNTAVVNLLGLCALTLPAGLDKAGMPVGLQLMMPPNEELRLLAAGLAAEAVLGTAEKRLGNPPAVKRG